MDDSFHGTSQDGFFVSNNYQYQNKFAIEGFSKDLIDGWMLYGIFIKYKEKLGENN